MPDVPDDKHADDSDVTLVCDLSTPTPASDDCLPHAAMGLGSFRAVGTHPRPTLVHRLVVQRQMSAWCVFRMDGAGGFVGETWHPDRADALRTACREFSLAPSDFRERRGLPVGGGDR